MKTGGLDKQECEVTEMFESVEVEEVIAPQKSSYLNSQVNFKHQPTVSHPQLQPSCSNMNFVFY